LLILLEFLAGNYPYSREAGEKRTLCTKPHLPLSPFVYVSSKNSPVLYTEIRSRQAGLVSKSPLIWIKTPKYI
jgi:hypothetical protein